MQLQYVLEALESALSMKSFSLKLEQKRAAELENAVERLRKERDEWKAKALNTVTEVMPFDVKLEEYHG